MSVVELFRDNPIFGLAAVALWVVGGVAKVVIREVGASIRAWFQFRPPPPQLPQGQEPRRALCHPVPKLLEARPGAEEAGRDEEPADDPEEVSLVVDVDLSDLR